MNTADARSLLMPILAIPVNPEPMFPAPQNNMFKRYLADPEQIDILTMLRLVKTCVLPETNKRINRAINHAQRAVAQLFAGTDDEYAISEVHKVLLDGIAQGLRGSTPMMPEPSYIFRYLLTNLPDSAMTRRLRTMLHDEAAHQDEQDSSS